MGRLKKMKNNKEVITPNELTPETKASMKTRIISAIVGGVIIIPMLILGDYFIFAMIAFFTIVATYEVVHCAKKHYNPALYIVAIVLALLMTFWPLIRSIPGNLANNVSFNLAAVYNAFSDLYISIMVLALGAFGLFFMVIIDKGFTVRDASFMFTLIMIVTVGFQSALYIRYLPCHYYVNVAGNEAHLFNLYTNLESSTLFLYVLIATFMTDIGAYFIGVFFGKHKMNPRISPKKTWEGFFGGIIFSSLCSFGFAMILFCTGHPFIEGILDLKHFYLILILSFLLPFVATLGDFVFSSAKRHFEIKDFGNIMPGHGGILDRLDSVIFSMITTAVFLEMIQYWSPFIK